MKLGQLWSFIADAASNSTGNESLFPCLPNVTEQTYLFTGGDSAQCTDVGTALAELLCPAHN